MMDFCILSPQLVFRSFFSIICELSYMDSVIMDYFLPLYAIFVKIYMYS